MRNLTPGISFMVVGAITVAAAVFGMAMLPLIFEWEGDAGSSAFLFLFRAAAVGSVVTFAGLVTEVVRRVTR